MHATIQTQERHSYQSCSLHRIAAFSFRWEVACPHLRIASPLSAADFELTLGSCTQHIGQAADTDLVLIQREFPPFREAYHQVLTTARQNQVPVVYETDDLLFELPPNHPCARHYRSLRMDLLRGLIDADAVIVSSDQLASEIEAYNANVFTIPNYLDDRIWQLRPYNQDATTPVIIGYMGTESHGPDLAMISEALSSVLSKYGERTQLKVFGLQAPPALAQLSNVRVHPTCIDSYTEFSSFLRSQKVDIFLAPLQDNKFNRCKSAIKFLEYSSLGVPGIYSDLTPYQRVVKHGINGFLASTGEDWSEQLCRLIDDVQLRQSLGDAALETVERDWLVTKNAPRIRAKLTDEIYPAALAASRSAKAEHLPSARFITQRAQSWYQEMNDELIQIGESRSWKFVQALHFLRVKMQALLKLFAIISPRKQR